jgi:hypothetical protein
MVVSDGSGAAPRLKARLMATGQEGTFGESGERFSATVEDTPSDSRELLARVDFAPDSDAGMESMLGFRQDLGFAGSVQSVAAVSIHPEIDGPGKQQGLDEAAIRTSETMHLGDEFDVEVGSTEVVGRFAGQSFGAVAAALPNASVDWRGGNYSVGYRVATSVPGRTQSEETQAGAWLPEVSVRNGQLVLERGLHHEIGWERNTNVSGMSVQVFAESIRNPVLEAMSHFVGANPGAFPVSALLDRASGMMRTAGPGYSSQGIVASVEHRLPCGNNVRITYGNGKALVMPALPMPAQMALVLAAAHPRRVQTYSISLAGTLDGTGTRWQATYRWQPEDTVNEVAPFARDAAEPYLNLRLRQPIRLGRDGSSGFEALLDLRNMLAEGYRPVLLTDGSLLVFAQDHRSIGGGLAFTF